MKNFDKQKILNLVRIALPYIIFALQLYLMDFCIRSFDETETLYPLNFWLPNLFTLSFIFLFVGIVASLKKRPKKIVYGIIVVFFAALTITQMTYYAQTSFAFSFQNMSMAGEGGGYIFDSLMALLTNKTAHSVCVVIIIAAIPLVIKMFSKQESFYIIPLFAGIVLFVILNCICLYNCEMLLPSQNANSFNTTHLSRAREVFKKFDERYACIKIGGFYEYTFRDIITPASRIDTNINAEEKEFLDKQFVEAENSTNSHTGIFEGKNVIFLQLEGMDSWLLNETDTPNLFALKNSSIDFVNHYTNATGGGSTINNEMAANTGFYMPLGAVSNMIFLLDNNFKTTLPTAFKDKGYRSNMFHMNKGVFYSRHTVARHLGYDKYFGLQDKVNYTTDLELDRKLIEDNDFYQNMFQSSSPFMHYLITYTPHAPYAYTGKDKILADEKFGENAEEKIANYSSIDYARLDAGETDKMVGRLIQALKDNNLYDNTVIVAYADHYQYGLSSSNEVRSKCGDILDLANQTPFFVWSSNCQPEKVEKLNMQIDVMPTLLNMFGIRFDKNSIVGHDVFDSYYPGLVFFQDKSYFDGTYYYKNDDVFAIDTVSKKATKVQYTNTQLSAYVQDLIAKNDIALLHNYFNFNE